MKIIFLLIIFFLSQPLYSQIVLTDTSRKISFDANRINDQTLISTTSEVFGYDSLYIWNDKRTLSEIMDERPGYFIFDFGLGGRNDINYNGMYSGTTGIFRDGIQINDNYYQGFDIQNISVNEIEKIEEISDVSSFFYGINTISKSINIISKDIFQPKPFSQLRFSQDRFGSVFADFIFSQPFSRKANVQLGVTKHSLDGRYQNSDFNIWRGRGRINLFVSPKFNAKFNFYLDNFERGLNDGLIYSPVSSSLADDEAPVVNPFANENLENYFYDISLTGRFLKNRNSLTRLKLYSNNSTRYYFDNSTQNVFYPSNYNHSILYGSELSQNIYIKHDKNMSSDILIGGNLYFNLFNSSLYQQYQNNYYSLKTRYDFRYKQFIASAFIRNDNIKSSNYLNAGTEAKAALYSNKDISVELNGGINKTQYIIYNATEPFVFEYANIFRNIPRTFYEIGGMISYKDFTISGEGYKASDDYGNLYGINATMSFISKGADLRVSYNYSNAELYPKNYFKSDLAYKGLLFRGKLMLKTGFDLKYYNIKYVIRQNQSLYTWFYTDETFPRQNQFIADFYVGARIGKANVNLTIANIFNSLVYDSYVFPLDDRGGFLNSISRFTIVWDFIN